jgi:hypothetical protein
MYLINKLLLQDSDHITSTLPIQSSQRFVTPNSKGSRDTLPGRVDRFSFKIITANNCTGSHGQILYGISSIFDVLWLFQY